MSKDLTNDTGEALPAEGKRAWVHPKVDTFAARHAEVFGNTYGGVDAGIYHS